MKLITYTIINPLKELITNLFKLGESKVNFTTELVESFDEQYNGTTHTKILLRVVLTETFKTTCMNCLNTISTENAKEIGMTDKKEAVLLKINQINVEL